MAVMALGATGINGGKVSRTRDSYEKPVSLYLSGEAAYQFMGMPVGSEVQGSFRGQLTSVSVPSAYDSEEYDAEPSAGLELHSVEASQVDRSSSTDSLANIFRRIINDVSPG